MEIEAVYLKLLPFFGSVHQPNQANDAEYLVRPLALVGGELELNKARGIVNVI